MNESRVASRYAKSLIDLAKEKGVLEDVKNDMSLFLETVEKNRELGLVLKNPIIKSDKKQDILNAIFSSKFNKLSILFLNIVCQKGRESYLIFISREFLSQYRSFKGIERAEVITTAPLNEDQRKDFIDLVARLTGKKAELVEKLDQEIIGGFVLTISDLQIDESIQSKLQKLKNNFSYNPYLAKI